jgi:hypothetical protein
MSNQWKHSFISEFVPHVKTPVSYDIEKGKVHFIFGKGIFGHLEPQEPAWNTVPKEQIQTAIEAAIKTEFF